MISSSWTYVNDDDVAGWTSTTDWMEYWSVGMQGITPVDGRQFAELNAKAYSTIYQDVPTTPGETVSWRFSHRGRTGVDVMRLLVGVPTATAEPTLVMQLEASTGQAWSGYSGDYVVPAGQTSTRFAFANVSSANGRASYGNLIDDFASTARCVALPTTTSTVAPPVSTTTTSTVASTTTTSTVAPPVSTTTTSTVAPPASTTVAPTTTAGAGVGDGGPDTDRDGIVDVDDPTPLLDAHIQFDGVERTSGETQDQLSYQLLLGNHGPADAKSTVIAITPPAGILITDWDFGSWTADVAAVDGGGALFGLGSTAEPICWLDAFVLRCEMGTVSSGWGMALTVDMTVYDDPGVLDARATIVAVGFDVDLDNNADQLAVGSGPSLISAIPDALAFTDVRLGMMWWLGGAHLPRWRIDVVRRSAPHRRRLLTLDRAGGPGPSVTTRWARRPVGVNRCGGRVEDTDGETYWRYWRKKNGTDAGRSTGWIHRPDTERRHGPGHDRNRSQSLALRGARLDPRSHEDQLTRSTIRAGCRVSGPLPNNQQRHPRLRLDYSSPRPISRV